ncbi:hypothetical protein NBG4_20044 [Candidatus Sulfobium mesophilum]|uniref:Uncharacterized protein n=1 Tax=Candidatus Sulfobium mesophilum TaxID=2016548 RepID=A0A2U3QFS1_9BACT|nr:hypothetical protein NBG4_20044 [Candidatus Sulfobium mesophilum]
MARVSELDDYRRIEDFIALANKGVKVELEIELKKQLVTQKVPQGVTEDMRDEMDMYMLTGDYIFKVGNDKKLVSKVYVFGSSEEPRDVINVNLHIANARLKMDYQRMKDTKIAFGEKYF